MALHWRKVTQGQRGDEFPMFIEKIAALPNNQLFRHNQAGDLPGVGDTIDADALNALTNAAKGKRGFTYTHKPVLSGPNARKNRAAVHSANRAGFTINLSADSLSDADALAELNIAPVVVTLPATYSTWKRGDTLPRTPQGRSVLPCPAAVEGSSLTCAQCQICAINKPSRAIIGFPAHGMGKRYVEEQFNKV